MARAYADLGRFDDARRSIDEALAAVQSNKRKDVRGGDIPNSWRNSCMLPDPDATKAEGYFQPALTVARQQQAKSWELRAAMSLARLWRDQGKVQKRANYLRRFTAGSLKGSTRAI